MKSIWYLAGAASLGSLSFVEFFWRAAHLDALDSSLRKAGLRQTGRTDLPAEVNALATRMGARADSPSSFTQFEQRGQMWRKPGGPPTNFKARQTIRHDSPGFMWRARMGPIVVADYLVDGTGGLDVTILGAFRVARMVGGTASNQGEALRYLAELPWCPDAILTNRALDWIVVDEKTIKVATASARNAAR